MSMFPSKEYLIQGKLGKVINKLMAIPEYYKKTFNKLSSQNFLNCKIKHPIMLIEIMEWKIMNLYIIS